MIMNTSHTHRMRSGKEYRHSPRRRTAGLGLLLLALLALPAVRSASAQDPAPTAGNIDRTDRFAWSETSGWQNWRSPHGGVTVIFDGDNGYLEGYAWSETLGWIRLGTGSGPYANTQAGNYGVNLDAQGRLSGYAWSEAGGWLSFSNQYGQVTLANKSFDGYAWSESVGWIHFKNAVPAYNVRVMSGGSVVTFR